MNNFQKNQQNENQMKSEGEVTIQKTKESSKIIDQNIGEYTDFEDIKD